MRTNFFTLFTILLITGFSIAGCDKDPEPEFETPATKLRGKVVLNGPYGGVETSGRAGTQAVLSGQFQNFTTTTDNTGRFEYNDLTDGTYTLTISREGYSQMKVFNILFSRNSPNLGVDGDYQIIPTVTLGTPSVSSFDSTNVQVIYETETIFIDTLVDPWITEEDTISASLYFRSKRVLPESFNPEAKYGYRLFFGKAPNVGPTNYMRTIHGVSYGGDVTEIEYTWTQSEWQNLGYNMDDMVYIKIYGDAVNPITYTTPGEQLVFPNLSDSLGVDSDLIIPF